MDLIEFPAREDSGEHNRRWRAALRGLHVAEIPRQAWARVRHRSDAGTRYQAVGEGRSEKAIGIRRTVRQRWQRRIASQRDELLSTCRGTGNGCRGVDREPVRRLAVSQRWDTTPSRGWRAVWLRAEAKFHE